MNTTAAEANLNANPDVGIHPPLSEYAKKLEPRVRQRYLEKISAIGIDPVLIARFHVTSQLIMQWPLHRKSAMLVDIQPVEWSQNKGH